MLTPKQILQRLGLGIDVDKWLKIGTLQLLVTRTAERKAII